MPRIEGRPSVFPSLRLERPPQIRVGRQPKEKLAHPCGLILIDLYLQDDVAWDLCVSPALGYRRLTTQSTALRNR